MYDDLGNQNLIVVLFNYNTRNILFNYLDSFLSGEQFMYDDLGNQNLIVVLFNYNTRNILHLSSLLLSHQHFYPTLLSALNIFSDGVVLLLLKTTLFGLKQVLSNFYAIGFLWRRCNFRQKETFRQAQFRKCRARYRDVAKTTCGIRQSNYLPLLLYRIPLTETL